MHICVADIASVIVFQRQGQLFGEQKDGDRDGIRFVLQSLTFFCSLSSPFFPFGDSDSFVGGHTKEMLSFLSTIDPLELRMNYTPRHYIIAETDTDSVHKVEAFEKYVILSEDLRGRKVEDET